MTAEPLVIDEGIRGLIQAAVREDVGSGDRTVELAIPKELRGEGRIVGRRRGVVCGTVLLEEIVAAYGGEVAVEVSLPDGSSVAPGQVVATLEGPVGKILTAERVLLNFLGHCSGVASATRRYVDAIAEVKSVERADGTGGPPAICDTRKTTPGFRLLDKYAVRCGGGVNDRIGLYDGVMLKDNHLAALREKLGAEMGLGDLTRRIRGELPGEILLWLEVDTMEQLEEELAGRGGADVILLDNFTPEMMHEAVGMRNQVAKQTGVRPLLEASGGITDQTLRAVAESGVERISIGALTHSAPVLDMSMEVG
jgi:nicotinate-nucleotide pyrophosphorylase (carboxylating)